MRDKVRSAAVITAATALFYVFLMQPASLAGRGTAGNDLSPQAREILDRIDRCQETLQTLRAEISETRSLKLLAEPESLRGVLRYEAPENLRWDYDAPRESSYVLADGRMTGWIPSENRVEVVDLSLKERRIRRLFAIGQDSESLAKAFEISAPESSTVLGTSELILVPKSRRLRNHVSEVRLWIDDDHGLPRQIRYTTGSGDEILLEMTKLDINEELDPKIFELAVPVDAEVVRGLSGMSFPGISSKEGGEL